MPALNAISVIIPVGPGDTAWCGLLRQLEALPASSEIILARVAGDARQPTVAPVVTRLNATLRLSEGPIGRARQLNRGASIASRAWLWFLHADSQLTPRTLTAIEQAPSGNYLGYFDLRFYDGPALMALTTLGTFVRSRWLQLPFGDQGFLISHQTFFALGGYNECLASGEDHALVWAARRAQVPLRPLRAPLFTSGRRYAEHGWLRVTGRHWYNTCRQVFKFASMGQRL